MKTFLRLGKKQLKNLFIFLLFFFSLYGVFLSGFIYSYEITKQILVENSVFKDIIN